MTDSLYNGIVLPDPWPPRPEAFAFDAPVTPPYLVTPPEVIPIDVGRQLFVDDFLIENTTLQRRFHLPRWHPRTPVLAPETPWEREGEEGKARAFAAPFSDGVWYDPQDQTIKMWYAAGRHGVYYATSRNGLDWRRPDVGGPRTGTNCVAADHRDSTVVWLDLEETDPARRFKMSAYQAGQCLRIYFSPDGIHWPSKGEEQVVTGKSGDRATIFYNPFRKVWVYSIRSQLTQAMTNQVFATQIDARVRFYGEQREMTSHAWGAVDELSRWTCADRHDRVRPLEYHFPRPDLYNLDGVAYESVMLGLFTVHAALADTSTGRPKQNYVTLGYSRDGFHWHRPDRRAFLGLSEDPKAWNYGNVQSAGGGCLVVGDELYFYCSGRNSGGIAPDPGDGGRTGLAVLRRDGFASMDADEAGGVLITRPLTFKGSRLFVNARVRGGELRVDVLDEQDRAVPGFSLDNCTPCRDSGTLLPITWRGGADLASLRGQPVRLRFHLTSGRLYSFWVSPDDSGASHGYVAAGGPGFTSNKDTEGRAAYAAAQALA